MKNSYIYMIGEIVPKVLSLMLLPIMTRYLTPEDYGVIGYIDTVILFVFIFSILALNSFMLREYFEQKTTENKKKLIGNFFIFLTSYNVVLFCIASILIYFVKDLVNLQFDIFPILICALIVNFLDVFCLFPQIIYRVQEKALEYIYFVISRSFFQILAVLLFLEYFFYGPISKYLGLMAVGIIYAGFSIMIVMKNGIFSFNISQLKDGFRFSLPLVLAALSFGVVDMSDRIILENYVSMSDLGIYSIAYALGFSINVIIKGSYKAFEPIIFKESKSKNFIEIFSSVKNEFLTIVLVTCIAVILFSQEIVILILPEEYYSAYMIIPIIVLAGFAKGIYSIQALLLMVNKDTKLISLIMILGGALNIGINLLFIEKYGIFAAAISTVVSFSIMAFLVHLKGFNYYKFSYSTEIKDYLWILLMSLLIYLLYFHLNISVTLFTTLIKIVILLLFATIIYRFYSLSMFKSAIKRAN